MRLEKQGGITSELLPSPLGPKRKYFSITEAGKRYLEEFESCWKEVSASVGRMVFGGAGDE